MNNPLADNNNRLGSSGEKSKVRSKFVPLGNVKVLDNDEVFGEAPSFLMATTELASCFTSPRARDGRFLLRCHGDESRYEPSMKVLSVSAQNWRDVASCECQMGCGGVCW